MIYWSIIGKAAVSSYMVINLTLFIFCHSSGRKKKSTRFSPGELENLRRQISLASGNGRETVKENQPLRNWSSNNDFITNGDPTFTEDPPVSLEQHEERVVRSMDDIEDLTDSGDVPLYYLRNK